MNEIQSFVKRLREKYKSRVSNSTMMDEYKKEFGISLLEERMMGDIVMTIDDEFENNGWVLDTEKFVYHNKEYTPPKNPPKNQQKMNL